MEQLLFGSSNLSQGRQPLQVGELDLFEHLRNLAQTYPGSVEIDGLPEGDLLLEWAEFARPEARRAAAKGTGDDLTNGRLAGFRFQYLGGFRYRGNALAGRDPENEADPEAYEHFEARLHGETVLNARLQGNGACNCTWLMWLLLRPEGAFNNPYASEKLQWKRSSMGGYQLTVSALSADRSRSEAHTISFNEDLSAYKWELHVAKHESLIQV